jgi:transposase
MGEGTTVAGLDAHKEWIKVAVLLGGETKAVEWQVANEKAVVRRMVRKAQRLSEGEVHFCYEAGPCGYALKRWIEEAGSVCVVVAPSLIPRKPGDRIKTDRRDARKLAELYRAGLLTEVQAPTPADEAARNLCRAREDAQEDLMRCRHRVSKMLLGRGWQWNGTKRAWSQGHRLWLRSLHLEHEADQVVLEDYLLAIEQVEQRLRWLEQRIQQLSQQPAYVEAVGALRCFRGIDTLTAMGLVTELHDFMRFETARGLMAFLGLVPSERSSADSQRRGGITKAGNRHARRLLIEAAWHYRHRPNTTRLRSRREGQPRQVVAIADKAMRRLNRRFSRMVERGKPRPKVTVAIARELAGFVWAALRTRAA